MGCSSQKNIEVDDSEDNKGKNNKKDKVGNKVKQNNNKKDNEDSEFDEEELEMDDVSNIENLKKKHMIHEYYFLPTKDIPKRRFVKKDKDKLLPSDFADKEKKKDTKYFCFIKSNTPKNNKNDIIKKEDESEKNNNLIEDDIYLFNQRMKQVKSIKPLKREEILKPYNYQIEYDINDDGILDKRSNKEKGNYDYLDMFPNGEGYKFVNNEEKPKVEKPKIKLPPKKNIDEEKKIEMIKKNDENDIANIINKELKENGLIENNKKVEDNVNDF
jgi:hypothetical protein